MEFDQLVYHTENAYATGSCVNLPTSTYVDVAGIRYITVDDEGVVHSCVSRNYYDPYSSSYYYYGYRTFNHTQSDWISYSPEYDTLSTAPWNYAFGQSCADVEGKVVGGKFAVMNVNNHSALVNFATSSVLISNLDLNGYVVADFAMGNKETFVAYVSVGESSIPGIHTVQFRVFNASGSTGSSVVGSVLGNNVSIAVENDTLYVMYGYQMNSGRFDYKFGRIESDGSSWNGWWDNNSWNGWWDSSVQVRMDVVNQCFSPMNLTYNVLMSVGIALGAMEFLWLVSLCCWPETRFAKVCVSFFVMIGIATSIFWSYLAYID